MSLILSLAYTTLQALLSSLFTMLMALVGATGLICLKPGLLKRLIVICSLLPNVLPVLFVILASLNFFHWFLDFPYGLWGIVLLHCLINTGIVCYGFSVTLSDKLGGMVELAWVEGAGIRQVIVPLSLELKTEIRSLFFSIFSLCFASFAVPMIIGRGFVSTYEVYIYEAIRVKGDFFYAGLLSLLQLFILFSLSRIFRPAKGVKVRQSKNLTLLHQPWAIVLPLFPAIVLAVGLFSPLITVDWLVIKSLIGPLVSTFLPTLMLSLLTGLGIYILLLVVVCFYPARKTQSMLYGLAAPSTVIVGFTLFLLGSNETAWALLKISLGLCLICLPIVYRFFIAINLQELRQQYEVALISGASQLQIVKLIMWPQMHKPMVLSAQIAALWAIGDFALSAVVAQSSFTLPLVIKDLLVGYRMEAATALCWLLILGGILIYFFIAYLGKIFSPEGGPS